MESVRVVKDEGRVPRDRSLVPMHLVASPFGPGGRLALGGSDSPLAQAVHGGAPVGKTVAEPGAAKVDGDERKEQAAVAGPSQGPMGAKERDAVSAKLREHVMKLFENGTEDEVVESGRLLLKLSTAEEIENLIQKMLTKPTSFDRKKRFELVRDGFDELNAKAERKDGDRIVQLIKEVLACRDLEHDQRREIAHKGIETLRSKAGFSDQELVGVYEEIDWRNNAMMIATRQTEPREWVVDYLLSVQKEGPTEHGQAAAKKLMEFARQVLLGEQPPTS